MLKVAGDYNILESFHIMFGKGWVDVAVDVAQKQVRFTLSTDRNVRKIMASYEEGFSNRPIPLQGTQRDKFFTAATSAARHIDALKHDLRDGRIVLLDVAQLNHPSIVAQESFLQKEFQDISDYADLGGFAVEDFQLYWLALSRWSHCVMHLYMNNACNGTPQCNCMPTQCVTKGQFISGISLLSGLNAGKA